MKVSLIKILVPIVVLMIWIYLIIADQPIFSKDLDRKFEEMTSISEVNDDLRLSILGTKTSNYGPEIKFLIENKSNQKIYFVIEPNNPHIKIFTVESNEWIEVKNRVSYTSITGGEGFLFFPDHSDQPNKMIDFVAPVFQTIGGDDEKQKPLRIFVFGELLSEGEITGTPVGAYVDLYVEP